MPDDHPLETTVLVLEQNVTCYNKTILVRPDENYIFHSHDACEIYLFLDGDAEIYVVDDCKHLERGDLVLIQPFAFHRMYSKDEETYNRVVINIKHDFLKSLSTEQTNLSACFYPTSKKQMNIIHLNEEEIAEFTAYSIALEQVLNENSYGRDVLVKVYLSQMLLFLNIHCGTYDLPQQTKQGSRMVMDAQAYIETHLAEDLSLQSIARSIHCNGNYLSRCFKQVMRISIMRYISIKRVETAKALMMKGYRPTEVCYEVGFQSYSTFLRVFKEIEGQSPKQFQQSKRLLSE